MKFHLYSLFHLLAFIGVVCVLVTYGATKRESSSQNDGEVQKKLRITEPKFSILVGARAPIEIDGSRAGITFGEEMVLDMDDNISFNVGHTLIAPESLRYNFANKTTQLFNVLIDKRAKIRVQDMTLLEEEDFVHFKELTLSGPFPLLKHNWMDRMRAQSVVGSYRLMDHPLIRKKKLRESHKQSNSAKAPPPMPGAGINTKTEVQVSEARPLENNRYTMTSERAQMLYTRIKVRVIFKEVSFRTGMWEIRSQTARLRSNHTALTFTGEVVIKGENITHHCDQAAMNLLTGEVDSDRDVNIKLR